MTGGTVEIQGQFNIDVTTGWNLAGVDVFFSEPNGYIVIEPNCSLTGNSNPATSKQTRFFPCTGIENWYGIFVDTEGAVSLNNCRVERACTGVYMNPSSRGTLTNNLFFDNHYGIDLLGSVMLLGEGIAHNQFIASSAVAVACLPNQSSNSIAIRVRDVPYVVIGDIAQNGAPNDIRGYEWGIYATHSNIDLYNSAFRNSTTAIRLREGNGVNTANIFGLGEGINDLFTIENVSFGISARDYNVGVEQVKMRNITTGIQNNQNQTPVSFVARDNYFQSFLSDGIILDRNTLNNYLIQNSAFIDDAPEVENRYCLNLKSIQLTNILNPSHIEDNKFYDNLKTQVDPNVVSQHLGVLIGNSPHAKVYNNEFYQSYDPGANSHSYHGVRLQNSSKCNVAWNTFHALYGPSIASGTEQDFIGNYNIASSKCQIACNYAEAFDKGFIFQDMLSNGSAFRINEMEGSNSDLYLAAGTMIGVQDDQKNKWPGGSPLEAEFDGDPNSTLLNASRFIVRDQNMNSDFWPNPVQPATGWFTPDAPDGLPPEPCVYEQAGGGGTGGQSAGSKMLIDGTFEPYLGYPATLWDMQLYAFDEMLENPELILETTENETFYNQHVSGNVGKLQNARRDWDNISLFDSTQESVWNDNQGDIDAKLTEIRVKAEAMQQAVTPAEQAQIAQILETLTGELEALQLQKSLLTTDYLTMRNNRATQLLADLSAVSTTTVWENNLKTVLDHQAQRLISGNTEWTPAQLTNLQLIAAQCRHEGGMGVILARAAIDNFDFDDEANCPGYAQYRFDLQKQPGGTTFPNPANDQITIRFESPLTGELQLLDLHGHLILSRHLNQATSAQIDTRNLANGLYFASLQNGGSAKWKGKISVAH